MAVIKGERLKGFTHISNTCFRDTRLSLKALGLLCKVLSLPENWQYSVEGLASIVKEGKGSVERALKELKAAGYVSIKKLNPSQTESGRYEYEYTVHEEPIQKQDPQNKPLETSPLKQALRKQDLENKGLEMGVYIKDDKSITKESITKIASNKSKSAGIQDTLDGISNEELRSALNEFIQYRKEIKKPVTPHTLDLLIQKLNKLASTDAERIEILNQSMVNGWQGIFALDKRKQSNPRTEHYDSIDKTFMDGEIV